MSIFLSDIKDAPLLALKYSETSISSSLDNLLLMVISILVYDLCMFHD